MLSINKQFQSAFVCTSMISLFLLTGCASTAITSDENNDSVANTAEVEQTHPTQSGSAIEANEDQLEQAEPVQVIEFDPLLPKLELDAQTLEQLLVSNLASYQGKWSEASENSLKAAESSRDYRLARIATLLALRNNDYATAVTSATLWLELKPDSLDASNMRLLSQIGAGQLDNALISLKAHAEGKTFDSHVRQIAGLITRQRNTETGIKIAEHYVQQHPESAQVMLSMAFVAESFAQDEAAEQWLARALELRPTWDLAAQMKANMLARLGRVDERAEFIQDYINANPNSIGMRINHAVELARLEQYQPALDVMQAVLLDAPQNVGALSYAGALAQQLEKTDLARQHYERVLLLDPSNDDARWSLGRMAAIAKNYVQAEDHFASIVDPQRFLSAQMQVANMRYHTRGIKTAINTLKVLEPQTEEQYIELALTRHYLLMQDHQYEEAFGSMNETLVYLPNNATLLYARGLVAAELEKLDIAEADFKSVLANQPDNANALNAWGYTLADQTERYDEALSLISRAVELRPQDAHILDSMGWVLYRMNDKEGAIEFLEKAFAASPEIEIAAHLGEVVWESGDHERAMQIWQESYNLDPSNPLLNETLERYGVDFAS